jgi:hypothetical protein
MASGQVPHLPGFMMSDIQTHRTMTPEISRPVISRRQKIDGPNHHLWFNHGSWWIHYTIHLPDHTKARRRRSLRTSDLGAARRLRDRILSGSFPPADAPDLAKIRI